MTPVPLMGITKGLWQTGKERREAKKKHLLGFLFFLSFTWLLSRNREGEKTYPHRTNKPPKPCYPSAKLALPANGSKPVMLLLVVLVGPPRRDPKRAPPRRRRPADPPLMHDSTLLWDRPNRASDSRQAASVEREYSLHYPRQKNPGRPGAFFLSAVFVRQRSRTLHERRPRLRGGADLPFS